MIQREVVLPNGEYLKAEVECELELKALVASKCNVLLPHIFFVCRESLRKTEEFNIAEGDSLQPEKPHDGSIGFLHAREMITSPDRLTVNPDLSGSFSSTNKFTLPPTTKQGEDAGRMSTRDYYTQAAADDGPRIRSPLQVPPKLSPESLVASPRSWVSPSITSSCSQPEKKNSGSRSGSFLSMDTTAYPLTESFNSTAGVDTIQMFDSSYNDVLFVAPINDSSLSLTTTQWRTVIRYHAKVGDVRGVESALNYILIKKNGVIGTTLPRHKIEAKLILSIMRQALEEESMTIVNTVINADVGMEEITDKRGCTLLHFACEKNVNSQILELLISAKVDCNAVNDDGYTALQYCAVNGNFGGVNALLKMGRIRPKGSIRGTIRTPHGYITPTALFLAAEKNYDKICDVLFQHRAEIERTERTRKGMTPLHIAAARGNIASLKVILDYIRNEKIYHILDMKTRPAACVRSFRTTSNSFQTPIRSAASTASILSPPAYSTPDTDDVVKHTALYLAAEAGHVEAMRMLLEAGADVNEGEMTPLHAAIWHRHEAAVECLVSHPRLQLKKPTPNNTSPLHLAVLRDALNIVNIIANENRKRGIGMPRTRSQFGHQSSFFSDLGSVDGDDIDEEVDDGVYECKDLVKSFLAACSNGQRDLITTLLDLNPGLAAASDKKGKTALICAIKNKQHEAVTMLIAAGAPVNDVFVPDRPLGEAVRVGDAHIVKTLLDARAHPHPQSGVTVESWFPIALAAEKGDEVILDILLDAVGFCENVNDDDGDDYDHHHYHPIEEKGKNTSEDGSSSSVLCERHERNGKEEVSKNSIATILSTTLGSTGWTPIFPAAKNGHLAVMRRLIAAGSPVDEPDRAGWTPLFWAAMHGHAACVKELIGTGRVDVHGVVDDDTALLIAARKGHIDVIEALREAGCDISLASNDGRTPLSCAVWFGHDELVSHLFSLGLFTPDMLNACSLQGSTLLSLAAYQGAASISSILMKGLADVNKATRDGNNPLHIAIKRGKADTVRVFLDGKNTDVNAADIRGQSPLHIAVACNQKEAISMLLAHEKCSVNQSSLSQEGATPLILASRMRNEEVIKLFLEARMGNHVDRDALLENLDHSYMDIDGTDSRGQTALAVATLKGHAEIVRILIEAVANVNKADLNHTTPLMSAVRNSRHDIAKMLLDAQASPTGEGESTPTAMQIAACKEDLDMISLLCSADGNSMCTLNADSPKSISMQGSIIHDANSSRGAAEDGDEDEDAHNFNFDANGDVIKRGTPTPGVLGATRPLGDDEEVTPRGGTRPKEVPKGASTSPVNPRAAPFGSVKSTDDGMKKFSPDRAKQFLNHLISSSEKDKAGNSLYNFAEFLHDANSVVKIDHAFQSDYEDGLDNNAYRMTFSPRINGTLSPHLQSISRFTEGTPADQYSTQDYNIGNENNPTANDGSVRTLVECENNSTLVTCDSSLIDKKRPIGPRSTAPVFIGPPGLCSTPPQPMVPIKSPATPIKSPATQVSPITVTSPGLSYCSTVMESEEGEGDEDEKEISSPAGSDERTIREMMSPRKSNKAKDDIQVERVFQCMSKASWLETTKRLKNRIEAEEKDDEDKKDITESEFTNVGFENAPLRVDRVPPFPFQNRGNINDGETSSYAEGGKGGTFHELKHVDSRVLQRRARDRSMLSVQDFLSSSIVPTPVRRKKGNINSDHSSDEVEEHRATRAKTAGFSGNDEEDDDDHHDRATADTISLLASCIAEERENVKKSMVSRLGLTSCYAFFPGGVLRDKGRRTSINARRTSAKKIADPSWMFKCMKPPKPALKRLSNGSDKRRSRTSSDSNPKSTKKQADKKSQEHKTVTWKLDNQSIPLPREFTSSLVFRDSVSLSDKQRSLSKY